MIAKQRLFVLGADMSAITKYGRTALHVAAANGKEVIVDLLLEHGGGKQIGFSETIKF